MKVTVERVTKAGWSDVVSSGWDDKEKCNYKTYKSKLVPHLIKIKRFYPGSHELCGLVYACPDSGETSSLEIACSWFSNDTTSRDQKADVTWHVR